jgi:hypothetical protein
MLKVTGIVEAVLQKSLFWQQHTAAFMSAFSIVAQVFMAGQDKSGC